MEWLILLAAGIFEVFWATGLKFSEGFTKPLWSVFTVAGMIISMALLGFAARTLPIGTAYAVWTGIGAAGTAVTGIYFFSESRDPVRLLFILLIVIGITGLKFYSQVK